jgi:hydroxymethylpyrimidine pyrophosphatase-like HAD family hydrolase
VTRFLALATDYDGTLAHRGRVDPPTLDALRRWKADARALILVTGRELPELLGIFPEIPLFDLVVAENGALLYRPSDRSESLLADPPPPSFAAELIARGADRVSLGRVVVATWRPHELTAQALIDERALPLQVILNKNAVMVLPQGVSKASGLAHALESLNLDPSQTASIGDAENDLAMLAMTGLGAAVANALPPVKTAAHLVTPSDHGAGVSELIDRLLSPRSLGRSSATGPRIPHTPGRAEEASSLADEASDGSGEEAPSPDSSRTPDSRAGSQTRSACRWASA